MSEFKKTLSKRIQEFKIKIDKADLDDNHAVAALHLTNKFKCPKETAIDQTSHGSHDHGIDAWFFSEVDQKLYIFQSKFSEDIKYIQQGLNDFEKAINWLESAIIHRQLLDKRMNHSTENLYTFLSQKGDEITDIVFMLISCFDESELEFEKLTKNIEASIGASKLNKHLNLRHGGIEINAEKFNCSRIIVSGQKKYNVSKILDTTIELPRKKTEASASLGLAYIPLFNLVKLYWEMGDRLFNKNVRLTLIPYKDSKARVVNPMEKTLSAICSGEIPPEIFTFYHIGITLSTKTEIHKTGGEYELEDPSIINGCQTVTIASRYLKNLEEKKDRQGIENFKKIRVVAKVVVGANDSDLREITNSNNRQNPIEDWQLYCNEEIHMLIEEKFKSLGVFYERQKGKFELIKNDPDQMKDYPNTKMNYIKIPEFGQVVALCRNRIQLAAKPAEIFSTPDNHSQIFNNDLLGNSENFILAMNVFRSLKYSLDKYQREDETYQVSIFKKPIIKMHLFYLGMLYMFSKKHNLEEHAFTQLQKVALQHVNEEASSYYRKVMRKTKNYFMQFEKEGKEVSVKNREKFFKDLQQEIGLKDIKYL